MCRDVGVWDPWISGSRGLGCRECFMVLGHQGSMECGGLGYSSTALFVT